MQRDNETMRQLDNKIAGQWDNGTKGQPDNQTTTQWDNRTGDNQTMQCFHKQNLAMRTWRSKALQWERRDLLSRMRPKCGPNLELLRTSSRYFHQNAMKSLKSTFCDKSTLLFIMEGMLYNPISQEMHALTLVLNLIDTSLSLFHSFTATFLS